tara:strand:+ start:8093 stop:8470 length:378 start_codon:yes stop_codon:yes gene_type:complete
MIYSRLILKILVAMFFSIFLKNKAFAEEYICFSQWKGNPTKIKLSRNINGFNMVNAKNKNVGTVDILEETRDFLAIGNLAEYPYYDAFYLLLLDKNTMKYRSTSLIDPNDNRSTIPVKNGNCKIN